ncbi:hypothetical protein IT417_01205 [bacterium]|nr:hypothetical protein [bacterium]
MAVTLPVLNTPVDSLVLVKGIMFGRKGVHLCRVNRASFHFSKWTCEFTRILSSLDENEIVCTVSNGLIFDKYEIYSGPQVIIVQDQNTILDSETAKEFGEHLAEQFAIIKGVNPSEKERVLQHLIECCETFPTLREKLPLMFDPSEIEVGERLDV